MDRIVVVVQTRRELDAALDKALEILKPVAVTGRLGIVVTLLGPGRYEARLDAEGRPGMTRECWGAGGDESR